MKKQLMWLIELFVWGMIIFSAIFVTAFIQNKNLTDKHTYYVFFKDVDGLIKGSPVKIQGFQVGHITNISLMDDNAFVSFVITDKKIEMPDSFNASVAFTGMGGSKSLELFVPKNAIANISDKKNYVTTIEPKRINDFYIYQNQIAQNLVTMTSDFMKMFDDRTTEAFKDFVNEPTALENIDLALDNIQEGEVRLLKRMEKENNDDNQ